MKNPFVVGKKIPHAYTDFLYQLGDDQFERYVVMQETIKDREEANNLLRSYLEFIKNEEE